MQTNSVITKAACYEQINERNKIKKTLLVCSLIRLLALEELQDHTKTTVNAQKLTSTIYI